MLFAPSGKRHALTNLRRIEARAGALPGVEVLHLARGAVLGQAAAEFHSRDPHRREDVLPDPLLVALAGDGLDDAAEDEIAEVRVDVFRAGIEIERLAHHVAHDVVGPGGGEEVHFALDAARNGDWVEAAALVAIPAASVLEAVADGDLLPALVRLGARRDEGLQVEVAQHRVVELDLAPFDELQHRDRRDRLGDTGDAEERIGLHRKLVRGIGVAEARA